MLREWWLEQAGEQWRDERMCMMREGSAKWRRSLCGIYREPRRVSWPVRERVLSFHLPVASLYSAISSRHNSAVSSWVVQNWVASLNSYKSSYVSTYSQIYICYFLL